VAVDPRTGQVELIDYMAVEDVGRIVNPLTLHGQTVGAVVQGLGGALLEQFIYDDEGQLLTGSLADYLMPTASDFPRIRAVALEEKPAPHNPLGAKGAGEGGIIPVGGVVANAVAAALASLDVQPRELPLSPPRVWQLIKAAGARGRPQGPPLQTPSEP
jgi:carbon-monoxide dehydrogenase large subunit